MIELPTALRAIFENNKDDFQSRVRTLEDAVAAIQIGTFDELLRAAAERDAHRLAGSLGTFGLSRGSTLARELEQRFESAQRFVVTDAAHLAEVVTALRAELDTSA